MKIIVIKSYLNEVSEKVVRRHEDIIKSSVLFEARTYASKNLPVTGEQSIDPFLEGFRGQYIALKNDAKTKIQADLQKFIGTTNVASVNEQIDLIKSQSKQQQIGLEQLKTDKDRIVVGRSDNAYQRYIWLLYLFALGEVVINVSSFLHLGDILIVALTISFVLGFAQIIAAKTTTLVVREIPNPRKRRVLYAAQFLGFGVFSLGIGLLRYHYALQKAGDVPAAFLNPGTFASMNMMLIVASILLVLFYFPSKKETRDLDRIRQLKKEISGIQDALMKLRRKESSLITDRANLIAAHSELIYAEKQLLEGIDALYDTAVGAFKTENISKRTDHEYPECFRHKHDPLPDTSSAQLHFVNSK